MADKAPYKLTITLVGTRPDALTMAIRRIDELCGEHDQVGELKTRVVIESWKEAAVIAIREQLEAFLEVKKAIIDGEVTLTAPLVRRRAAPKVAPIPPAPTPLDLAIEQAIRESADAFEGAEVTIDYAHPDGDRTVTTIVDITEVAHP